MKFKNNKIYETKIYISPPPQIQSKKAETSSEKVIFNFKNQKKKFLLGSNSKDHH